MSDFPDKKEVDETRKWYYGIGYSLVAAAAGLVVAVALFLWLVL
jgi:hypothetical protein